MGHGGVRPDVGGPEVPAAKNPESGLQHSDCGDHIAAKEQAPGNPLGVTCSRHELDREPKQQRIGRNREEPFPSVVGAEDGEIAIHSEDGGNRS